MGTICRMIECERLTPEFVDAIPGKIEPGRVYISMEYATAVHNCCCGCGLEVVTPFSPTDWKLMFDGVSVSLSPSIGNWSFPCRSHYWIRNNIVQWAGDWSNEQVEAGRAQDTLNKHRWFGKSRRTSVPSGATKAKQGLLSRLLAWVRR